MNRAQADILVSDLAQAMGMQALALDESGMATLSVGELIVTLGHNAAADSLDLMACLDVIDATPARVAEALMANYANGAGGVTFATEPETGALVLQRRCLESDFGDGGLPAAFAGFVNDAEAWSRRLSALHGFDARTDEAMPAMGPRA